MDTFNIEKIDSLCASGCNKELIDKAQNLNLTDYLVTADDVAEFCCSFMNITADVNSVYGDLLIEYSDDSCWEGESYLLETYIAILRDWMPQKDFTLLNLLVLSDMNNPTMPVSNPESYRVAPFTLLIRSIQTGLAPKFIDGLFGSKQILCPTHHVRKDGLKPLPGAGIAGEKDYASDTYARFILRMPKKLQPAIITAVHARLLQLLVDPERFSAVEKALKEYQHIGDIQDCDGVV